MSTFTEQVTLACIWCFQTQVSRPEDRDTQSLNPGSRHRKAKSFSEAQYPKPQACMIASMTLLDEHCSHSYDLRTLGIQRATGRSPYAQTDVFPDADRYLSVDIHIYIYIYIFFAAMFTTFKTVKAWHLQNCRRSLFRVRGLVRKGSKF